MTLYKLKPMNQDEGFYLHASAVNTEFGAVLFMGHSTSGKSTISKKLSGLCHFIADDVVRVVPTVDGYQVTDGKDRLSVDEHMSAGETESKPFYPLVLTTRLFKASKTSSQKISERQNCRYLADALFEVDIQRQMKDVSKKKQLFRDVAKLARSIPGIKLFFCLDSTSDDILKVIDYGRKER